MESKSAMLDYIRDLREGSRGPNSRENSSEPLLGFDLFSEGSSFDQLFFTRGGKFEILY